MTESYERLNSPSTSDSKLESAQMPAEPGQQLPLIEDDLSCSQTIFNTALNRDDVMKFLGTLWKRKEDELRFDFLELAQNALKAPVTKRSFLSTTFKIYDPLGLLCPAVLPLKLLFQRVCQLKLHWDDPLPEHLNRQWSEILEDMRRISFIEIPRCNIFLWGMEFSDIKYTFT